MGEWKENCNSWGGITLLPNLNISHSTTQLCLYFQQHLPSCLRKKKKKLPCLRSPATWPVAQTTDFGQNHHPCDAWRPNQSKWDSISDHPIIESSLIVVALLFYTLWNTIYPQLPSKSIFQLLERPNRRPGGKNTLILPSRQIFKVGPGPIRTKPPFS